MVGTYSQIKNTLSTAIILEPTILIFFSLTQLILTKLIQGIIGFGLTSTNNYLKFGFSQRFLSEVMHGQGILIIYIHTFTAIVLDATLLIFLDLTLSIFIRSGHKRYHAV